MEQLIFTVAEVAKILKINRNFVYDLINNGLLKSIKLGRTKVTRTSLNDFLAKYDGMDFADLSQVQNYKKAI